MTRIYIFLFSLLTAVAGFSVSTAYGQNPNDFSAQQEFGMTFDEIKGAASQGDPDAEYALGYMYYYGKGTPRDQYSARLWIEKAASQGQPQAIKALHLLGLTKNPKEGSAEGQVQIDGGAPSGRPSTTHVTSNIENAGVATTGREISPHAPIVMPLSGTAVTSNGATVPASAVTGTSASANSAPGMTSSPTSAPTGIDSSAATSASANVTGPGSDQHSVQNVMTQDVTSQDSNSAMTANVPASTVAATDTSSGPVVKSKHKHAMSSTEALSKKKLMSAAKSDYTIQLLGAYRESDLIAFVNAHNLHKKTYYFRSTDYKGRPWYVLVYGIYPSDSQAKQAIKNLPTPVKKLNPWIKSLKMVQEEIKTEAAKG